MSFLSKVAKAKLSKGLAFECIQFCNRIAKIGKRNNIQFTIMYDIFEEIHIRAINKLTKVEAEDRWPIGKIFLYISCTIQVCKNYYNLKCKNIQQFIEAYNLLAFLAKFTAGDAISNQRVKFKKEIREIKLLQQKAEAKIKHYQEMQHNSEGASGDPNYRPPIVATVTIIDNTPKQN